MVTDNHTPTAVPILFADYPVGWRLYYVVLVVLIV